SHSATAQAVGQATWACLLSAYIGEPSVTFGTVFSNRVGSASEATAFPSLSTVPIACSTDKTYDEIVADMVSYNASAHRHRKTPLADIQRLAGDAQRPLFDTIFVYQKPIAASRSEFDWPVIRETAAVEYVASLELETHTDGTVGIRLTADIRKIPIEQAEFMLLQYDYMLDRIINSRNSEPVVTILSAVPARAPELHSKVQLLHQFVELMAQEKPDGPALDFVRTTVQGLIETVSWTYRQLDQRGNQVANLLHEHGVTPGSIIAVRMQQCPEASFAFIGILKAGCSFLALDPNLPHARQAFILEDSNAAMLLVGESPVDSDGRIEALNVRHTKLTEDLLRRYPIEILVI
ncbi:hypothetical protein LTR53_018151, partial [Teratosphaeriaceae sp. CCFEE 6253]